MLSFPRRRESWLSRIKRQQKPLPPKPEQDSRLRGNDESLRQPETQRLPENQQASRASLPDLPIRTPHAPAIRRLHLQAA
ncbi:hypothetical protein NEIELOOT_02635 [Neisseria elongata subsp. glycolytica ATCC 29315]|uniref:Uncharacterized protein n=1 Tax=Neisseria elongata subsp. glycolytica ATCC 29315 TaxID=546263 RepID=D4DU78_NEIEG|nr:hypothetical protein NEIELOOT_02635 [Neisseria elongata subsp. glycolytica ATCC 29315]